jgi:serine protease AprX
MRSQKTGTSMSAPHVAGVVSLMFQKNPNLTAAQVRKVLIASARQLSGRSLFDPAIGHGVLDARRALDLVEQMR